MAALSLASFHSPGVYVKETESGVKAITGVSTSTAGFIGVYPAIGRKTASVKVDISVDDAAKTEFALEHYPVVTTAGSFRVFVGVDEKTQDVTLANDDANCTAKLAVSANVALTKNSVITIHYDYEVSIQALEDFGLSDGATKEFLLKRYPLKKDELVGNTVTVLVDGEAIAGTPTVTDRIEGGLSKVVIKLTGTAPAKGKSIRISYRYFPPAIPVNKPILCTNFGEFRTSFFDFSANAEKSYLVHAVLGFFNNGGSRCYVICSTSVDDALTEFQKVDEIAVVAAPGRTDAATQKALIGHCTAYEGIFYRVAILDAEPTDAKSVLTSVASTGTSDYAALYYPWIQVADPNNPKATVDVPPSGHVAGIYARVDTERGVHKAPANETIRGALGVTQLLSRPQQDGLNPQGINCIRVLNNNILVWGARTIGGDLNQDLKYINVRRTLLFLRKSIDQSTQWVVFEPNTPALWQKITRNVSAFLTGVWRSGALFGDTPEQAFYVKCDLETNTADVREAGAVVTEIGVAIARPAEFVIFQISQLAAGA